MIQADASDNEYKVGEASVQESSGRSGGAKHVVLGVSDSGDQILCLEYQGPVSGVDHDTFIDCNRT